MLLVRKYGGSSLATPRLIQRAARCIGEVKRAGNDVVVVVSAMGRTTDHLIRLAHRTVRRPPQRELDMLMTVGERISMSLLAMALDEEGVPAISFTGSQTGIVTTGAHTEARILAIRGNRIQEELARGRVVIVAGFQGVSEAKEITTLGRGGSDTSAVAIAAALKADRCEILTDVEGLFSADPRLVPSARLLRECSYDEALELASLGAKMQSRSIEVAKRYGVDVRIASSAGTPGTGTRLVAVPANVNLEKGDDMESTVIRGIATKDGFDCFEAVTSLATVTDVLRSAQTPLRFFQYGGGKIVFLCGSDKGARVADALAARGIAAERRPGFATVAAVGDGLSACPELLPRFLSALGEVDLEPRLVSLNSLSVAAVIPSGKREQAARLLHERLVETQSADGAVRGPTEKKQGTSVAGDPPNCVGSEA